MNRIELRAGALRLQVAPQAGGSIARFDRLDETGRRCAIFRGTDEDYGDVLKAGCFPIVPYANRIRDGAFTCNGRRIALSPNMAGDPNPLHGQGWRNPWQPAAAASERGMELRFEHASDEWPWRYAARQSITLDEDGLTVQLSCRNLDLEPMPCGLGLHPYFPCSSTTILDTVVSHAWTVDNAVLPVARVPAEGRYDLRMRRICGQGLDNGFDGWGQLARIGWPESGIRLEMSSSDAERFQLYSPASGGVFVAEPVHNANTALNGFQADWASTGLRMLARDEEAVLKVRFDVRPLAATGF